MALLDEIRAKKPQLLEIAKQYGVSDIRIFGSVARGEEGPDSDVDLLVKLEKTKGGFALGGFVVHASKLLGRDVQVSSQQAYHYPDFKRKLIDESLPL